MTLLIIVLLTFIAIGIAGLFFNDNKSDDINKCPECGSSLYWWSEEKAYCDNCGHRVKI